MDKNTQESKFHDEHYCALGKIITLFQSIEGSVDTLLLAFMGQDILNHESLSLSASRKLILEAGFNSKLEVLNSILAELSMFSFKETFLADSAKLEDKFISECEHLKVLLVDAKECQSIRNRLVHSNWIDGGIGVKESSVRRQKFKVTKKGVKTNIQDWTIEIAHRQSRLLENTAKALVKKSGLFISIVKR